MKPSTQKVIISVAMWGSLILPLIMSILHAAPESYWLDSPEFTAAAQTLGIPHPPGHPLYVMLVKPFTLLPFGSIALRVSLASAVFGAIACLLLFKSLILILEQATDEVPLWVNAIVAFGAVMSAFVCHGWWFQCVRQEVYSLQILLVLGALYPLIAYSIYPSPKRIGLLFAAAFVFGIGLCNHHFIMLAALPAAIPVLVGLARHQGGFGAALTTAKLTGIAALGLLPYAFLPLRSAAGAPISLGGVHSISDFFWVVSARVYQKSITSEEGLGHGSQSMDTIYSMMNELGPVLVIISLAGFYLLLRRKKTQLTGLVVVLLGSVSLLLRTIMGFDPFNPDYYGYMLPTIAAIVIGAAVFVSIGFHVLYRTVNISTILVPTLALVLIASPVYRARENRNSVDLSRFNATRLLFDFAIEDTPPGTLVLTSYYKLFFVLWSAKYVDGSRPDVEVVNPQLFGYPGYLAATVTKRKELKRLAWSMFVHGELTEESLSDITLQIPVAIDPSPWIEEKANTHILPNGILYTASPQPFGLSDVKASAIGHMEKWKQFYRLLGSNWKDHETWRMLSWCHYLDAIYFARRGDRDSAFEAIAFTKAIGSSGKQIIALEDALKKHDKGPFDVSPFLVEPTKASKQK